MTDFVPAEKAVPIRQPATANLMIDSADRNLNPAGTQPNPFDFQITKNTSIMNGYFTRIGTTEVVLEWNEPNGNYFSTFGTTSTLIYSNNSTISTFVNVANPFGTGFYNVQEALENFNLNLNEALTGTPFSTIIYNGGSGNAGILVSPNAQSMFFQASDVTKVMGLTASSVFPPAPVDTGDLMLIQRPDLRPFRYIDFTSQQLTYNQDLKDTATSAYTRDVLCRWYFDWDQQPQRDALGFPIEMGYEPFKLRRLFNPPKQIRWDPKQPAGNLAFQVYGNGQASPIQPDLRLSQKNSEWLMTLQVSEN